MVIHIVLLLDLFVKTYLVLAPPSFKAIYIIKNNCGFDDDVKGHKCISAVPYKEFILLLYFDVASFIPVAVANLVSQHNSRI